MQGGSKKPPATTRLAQLLQNPDLLSMNLNYQSTREAFLDVAYQLDDFQRTMSLFEEAESRYMKVTDMRSITQNIDNINTQLDRNTEDLSTEIRDLRAYFTFQLKDLNSKLDKSLTNVINEIVKPSPAAPAPANSTETPAFDDSHYQALKSEIDNLKERFEALMMAISKPISTRNIYEEEEEESNENDAKSIEEGGTENSSQHLSTGRPVTPSSSETSELQSASPQRAENENEKENIQTQDESQNIPKQNEENSVESQSNEQNDQKSKNFLNRSTSSPRLTNVKQIANNLRPNSMNAFKRIIEMRIDDMKIQLDRLNSQVGQNEEKLNPLIPAVQKNSVENGIFRPELMKVKADVMLLKGDLDIIKDSQANSVVDFMKLIKENDTKTQGPTMADIEKPLTAMRQQIMKQFARMENAFNEQLKKLKAEIIGIKTTIATVDPKDLPKEVESQIQSLLNDEDDQIKVAETFANEEPAEKALLEQMQEEAEKEKLKKQEELEKLAKEAQEAAAISAAKAKEEREKEVEKLKKNEEEKFLAQSEQATNSALGNLESPKENEKEQSSSAEKQKEVEVETEKDENSRLRYDTYTEVKNLPNQLIVSVLADSPPCSQKVEKSDMTSAFFPDEAESKKPIEIKSTLAFEYARIGGYEGEDLANVKKDIQCHQEIIERIVSQISEMGNTKPIEVPSLSSVSQSEKEDLPSLAEINALKEASSKHQKSIDDITEQVNKLITLSKFSSMLDEEKKDEKAIKEFLEKQSQLQLIQNTSQQRQIVLTPVHFTPLNLEPLKVHKIKSNSKEQQSEKRRSSKTEVPKAKNPVKSKKPEPPNQEAPAPALNEKTKKETAISIEVPPKPSSSRDTRTSKHQSSTKNERKKESAKSSTKAAKTTTKEDVKNEPKSSKENVIDKEEDKETNQEKKNETNETNVENETKEANEANETNENEQQDKIDDENQDILQDEEEVSNKSPKSAHKSSSHHTSRHSSSHHSSRTPKGSGRHNASNSKPKEEEKEEKGDNAAEGEQTEKQENAENANENVENKENEKENDEEEQNEEEEDNEKQSSQNSAEFFSPADSSVGSSVAYESNRYEGYEEEEEEAEEKVDNFIKEKIAQLNENLSSHQEQIKNIREGLVEIRSTVQRIKSEMKEQQNAVVLPQMDLNNEDDMSQNGSKIDLNQQIGDDNAIRAVRRRFDMQTREFENELYEIRKEIMEIRHEQSKMPQAITERIIQMPGAVPQIPPKNIPASPESVADEDEGETKKKKKKENIFSDENKLLEIKPITIPNTANNSNKVPKLPIVDQPSANSGAFTQVNYTPSQQQQPLVINSNQILKQPSTPKLKKLPPISPSPSMIANKENEEKEAENKDAASLGSSARANDYHPFFNNVVQQTINELNVLNACEDVDKHVLNLIIEVRSQLMLIIDKNSKRLSEIESKIDNFVDKDYIQKFFQKMRAVITELNSNVLLMKQTLPERVTKDELQNIIEELYHNLTQDQETSGGTSNYRCLLCGRPKTSISGMIKDLKVAETLGQPTQTTITQSPNNGGRGTLIYGPDKQLYRGKGNFGRPTIAVSESKKPLPKMK